MKNKAHWFISPTGHIFYTFKVMNTWRFVGRDTYVIKEINKLSYMKEYVNKVFGFEYLGSL